VGANRDLGAWNLSLDEPGSATRATVVRSVAAGVLLGVAGLTVVLLGGVRLSPLPTFTTAHASWVFAVDITTGWVLLLQLWTTRRTVYAVLSATYLVDAFLMPTFVLAFPGALRPGESVIGGSQSSIWVWHAWHVLFALSAVAALVVEGRHGGREVAEERVTATTVAAVAGPALVAAGVTVAVTTFAGRLPVLITPDGDRPLTTGFYVMATGLVVLTGVAMLAFWVRGAHRRSALHLWVAVALTAFFVDALANVASVDRFTVGWYSGRVASVIASTVLLVVFLSEVSRLYRKLVITTTALASANDGLVSAMAKQEQLVVDLRRSGEQVRQLAFYDELTDLPNRRLLTDRARLAVAQVRRHGGSLAVLFVDLDGFKEINDRLGHDVGDAVLREVAARLLRCSRSGDTVARVGGDEFVLLLTEVAHARDAGRVAEKVLEALVAPLVVGPHVLEVTSSIGIALHPDDERDDLAALLKDADMAMYAAKAAGRNRYRFYGDLPLARGTVTS
jgi:diguanylate cyclase (GGDEF)-like protein